MLPALHVEGSELVDANGKMTRLAGAGLFALWKRWLMPDGPHALVEPVLDDVRACARDGDYGDRPLVARVFRLAAPPNAFALDPWSYPFEQVASFMSFCEARNFYVDWTAGDYHICFPSSDPQLGEVNGDRGINKHNNLFCAAMVGNPNGIWNSCNETFKNGVDVSIVKPPPWAPAVRYSGEYGDSHDPGVDLTTVNLHTDRSEEAGAQKWVGKAHESAPYMWRAGKPVIYDEGMGADEIVIPGRRSNVPDYFKVMGSVLTMVSLVYFHSTDGIACNLYRPITRQCAVAFFRGAAGALL